MENKMITYNKDHYAVIANDIIKGKQEMTLSEARIIRLLITQVVKEDKDLKTYTCRIQDLAKFLGIDPKGIYRDVRYICKNLLKRVVSIETNNPKDPWRSFHWIQLASYDGNGNITLELSEKIAPYVLELNSWFTQYKLENILEFNSFYAIRLYEILKCDRGIAREEKYEFYYNIEYLREIFCCEEKYKKINDFIKKVINISVREINDKSDMTVTFECIKTSRKITEIKFELGYNLKTLYNRKTQQKTL